MENTNFNINDIVDENISDVQNNDFEGNATFTPIMQQYLSIKDDYKEYLLFFRMGDFYELFFEDAKIASKCLDLVLTQRDKNRGGIPMCGMPAHASENYFAKLLRLGYKVAVCEQTEDVGQKSSKGPLKREVVKILTPGTITEDNFLESVNYNFLACIYVSKDSLKKILQNDNRKSSGNVTLELFSDLDTEINPDSKVMVLSYLDLSTGEFFVQNISLNEIPSILEKVSPKELVLPEYLYTNERFISLMDGWRMNWRLISRYMQSSIFDYYNGYQVLTDFYKIRALDGLGNFSDDHVSCMSGLFEYVRITQVNKKPYISVPTLIQEKNFLKIDAFTLKNLDIFNTHSAFRNATLFHTLDNTVTAMGARQLRMFLTYPLQNVDLINGRLNVIEFFIKKYSILEEVRIALQEIPDIKRIMSRVVLNKWTIKDIFSLKNGLHKIKEVKKCFDFYTKSLPKVHHSSNVEYGDEGVSTFRTQTVDDGSSYTAKEMSYSLFTSDVMPQLLEDIVYGLGDYDDLCDNVFSCLNDTLVPPQTIRDGNIIRSGFSKDLDDARNVQETLDDFVEKLQHRYIELTGINTLKIKSNNLWGYFIEVPSSQQSKVLHEFVKKQTTLNSIRYTTVELAQFEQKLKSANDKVFELESNLFLNVVEKIVDAKNLVYSTAMAVGYLDVFSSLARIAVDGNYTRPFVDDSEDFIVKDAKHPVIDHMKAGFIENDCQLIENDKIWLLTGPNMAGKSTFLRQNALIVIMAQIGSFIPASYAKIGCVDKLFSRIGAADDLASGRSTFMVEMIETSIILRNATNKSFVILDELGRGTSTYDGLAIAVAVLEKLLLKNKCRTLFATHYHEIASMVKVSCYNMQIVERDDELKFLYKVVSGNAKGSCGINVAKIAGIEDEVIMRANEILQKLQADRDCSAFMK